PRDGKLGIEQADDTERDRHEHAEAARDAIEAVDEIDDIRHSDEPEYGDQIARHVAEGNRHGAAGIGELVDLEIVVIDERGDEQLAGEFYACTEWAHVVPQAEAEHQQRAKQDGEPLRVLLVAQPEDIRQPTRDGDHDWQAANARDFPFMALAR